MDEVRYLLREDDANDLSITDIISILIRRWFWWLIPASLIVIMAIWGADQMDDYYELPLRYYSTVGQKEEVGPAVEYLSGLTKEKDYEALAVALDLTFEEAMQIKSISLGAELQNQEVLVFEVQSEIFDPSGTETVANAIRDYLQSVDFLKRKYEIRKVQLQEQLKNAQKTKAALDRVLKETDGNNAGSIPDGVFMESYEIQEGIAKTKEKLDLLSAADLYVKPVPPIKPAGPKRLLIIFGTAFLALFLFGSLTILLDRVKAQSSN